MGGLAPLRTASREVRIPHLSTQPAPTRSRWAGRLSYITMPKGKDHRFSSREHRMAMHVKASMKKEGKSEEEAERIGWMTVNSRKKKGLSSLKKK